jgi:hypothetical protein
VQPEATTSDSSEVQALLDAAEKAAAAGDWASAEEHLRRAAADQEKQLGPRHTDLANTFNNLGVACEHAGRPDEAEQFYRRAYAIAAAALPLDDPLVVTCRQNLREFCDGRGKPFDVTSFSAPPAPAPGTQVESEPPSSPSVDVTSRSFPSAAGIAVVVGVVIAAVIGWRAWSGSGEVVESVEPQEVVSTEAPSAPAPAEPPAPGAGSTSVPEPPPAVRAERPVAPPSSPVAVSLVEARLCSKLTTSDWRCVPATSPTSPGLIFFYTRVRSASPTTIEHRWYYEERLLQTAPLNIGANEGSGYRTNSRQTIGAARAGNWRVELRSRDGSVLHEERFVVRP